MKRLISILTVFGLTVFLATGQASANIEYKFSGVTLSDGGTVTGTFTTNDSISDLVDWDITTSPRTDAGYHFTPETVGFASNALPFIFSMFSNDLITDTNNNVQVTFNGLRGLSATGGPIKIATSESFASAPHSHLDIVAGQVVVVPEPESYAMLLAGLGLVGFIARARKQLS